MKTYFVDDQIEKAETLPNHFYTDSYEFHRIQNEILAKSWQFIGHEEILKGSNNIYPFRFLEHSIQEPLLLVRDQAEQIHCLSNICTHRANILIQNSGSCKQIICGYHGRRFNLQGQFQHMPEFSQAENFPRPFDHLKSFPMSRLGPFLFTALDPAFSIDEVLENMKARLSFLPIDEFRFRPDLSKEYIVHAHWALYCDNYLEGFHIPFVHEDLNQVIDYGQYKTELYSHMNLQVAYAKSGESSFEIPSGHSDFGKSIAAYYFWIFPNMMFNFYPWGLSINVVHPLTKNKTKVSFYSYVWKENKLEQGAGAQLDKVEREDEFVVESVQEGISSRTYTTGRFSPTREQGVHQFHRLLAFYLNQGVT